jgi:hypothetical protein
MFNQFPSLLTFFYPKENFYLSGQLSDRCHNNTRIMNVMSNIRTPNAMLKTTSNIGTW